MKILFAASEIAPFFRTGGLAEVITPGVDGWLCGVGDCRCMAERASDLLKNPEKARAFGAAGRRKALERFAPGPLVQQYEAVYRRVMDGGGT